MNETRFTILKGADPRPVMYKGRTSIDLRALVDITEGEEALRYTEQLRALREANLADYKAAKSKRSGSKIYTITPSGVFSHRKNDNEHRRHNFCFCYDWDELSEETLTIQEQKEGIIAELNAIAGIKVIYAAVSLSGFGIHAIVRANISSTVTALEDAKTHKMVWETIASRFSRRLQEGLDWNIGDLSRALFIGHDADLYAAEYSEEEIAELPAIEIDEHTLAKYTERKKQVPRAKGEGSEDAQFIERCVAGIEAERVDITGNYNDWLGLGFGLAAGVHEGKFGEDEAIDWFNRISQFSTLYNPAKDHPGKMQTLLADYDPDHPGGAITLASFIHAVPYHIQEAAAPVLKLPEDWAEANVVPFPFETFPNWITDFIKTYEINKGFNAEYFACACLTVAAAIVGERYSLNWSVGHTVRPTVYLLGASRTGTKKSAMLKTAAEPIKLYDYGLDEEEHDQGWHYIADFTPEALDKQFEKVSSVLVRVDEGEGFINGLGRYGPGKESAFLGALNRFWDNEGIHRTLRVDKTRTANHKGGNLGLFVSIQPTVLQSALMDKVKLETGFLSRFLVSIPANQQAAIEKTLSPGERERIAKVSKSYNNNMQLLYGLAKDEHITEDGTVHVEITEEARELATQIRNELTLKSADPVRDIVEAGHYSKAAEYLLRLSVVVKMLWERDAQKPVTLDHVEKASKLIDYFSGQFINLLDKVDLLDMTAEEFGRMEHEDQRAYIHKHGLDWIGNKRAFCKITKVTKTTLYRWATEN